MAMTAVQICNLALSRLGNSSTITSLTDTTLVEAIQANLIYATTRDALLREYPWRFAVMSAQLLAEAYDLAQTRFLHVYYYPDDCLRVLRVYLADTPADRPQPPFEVYSVNNDSEGKFKAIATDLEEPYMDYISRSEDPNDWDAQFVDVLAWRLAAELAVPLGRDFQRRDALYRVYMQTLTAARTNDLSESSRTGIRTGFEGGMSKYARGR